MARSNGPCRPLERAAADIALYGYSNEILAMLAAGRASADIARIFRVHRVTASRIAAELRTPFQCDGLY